VATAEANVLPNLIIAGAPRCGTTSLFAWLTAHPDVCGTPDKEARFFLDGDDPDFKPDSNYRDHGLDGYAKYFSQCREASRIVVEATPDYLYQETAPRVLSSLDPLPQIIFILREPAERSYSHFVFLRDSLLGLDPKLSFYEFVRLVERESSSIPAAGHARKIIAHSRYVEYLDEWTSRFPQSHMHICLFEHLAHDSRALMQDIASQIGIDPSFYESYDFPPKNQAVAVRSRLAHANWMRVGGHLPRRARRIVRKSVAKTYARINLTPPPPRTPDDALVLRELRHAFVPHNERLARDLDLDLSPWLEGSRESAAEGSPPAPQRLVQYGSLPSTPPTR
jgi:Sulfotransferase domain